MSQARKIKAQVETTFKKIKEGLDEFEVIWEKVYDSTTQAQKEKYEEDLKKQIKKLQRFRENLKSWALSSDSTIVQYSSSIIELRKEIEERMERFRECEKETKTKAFSKEGLRQQSRQNPEDERRDEVTSTIQKFISDLHKEIDDCEVEAKRESNKKRNSNKNTIAKMEGYLKNHHWHIDHLEMMLRQIDNEILDPYEVKQCLDDVQKYIDNYRSKGFMFDDSIYDELDLERSESENEDMGEDEDEEEEEEEEKGKEKEEEEDGIAKEREEEKKKSVMAEKGKNPPARPTPAVYEPPKPTPIPLSKSSSTARPVIPVISNTVKTMPTPMNYAHVIQRGSSQSSPSAGLNSSSSPSSSSLLSSIGNAGNTGNTGTTDISSTSGNKTLQNSQLSSKRSAILPSSASSNLTASESDSNYRGYASAVNSRTHPALSSKGSMISSKPLSSSPSSSSSSVLPSSSSSSASSASLMAGSHEIVALLRGDSNQMKETLSSLPREPTFKPSIPADWERPVWSMDEMAEMMMMSYQNCKPISYGDIPYPPSRMAVTPSCFPQTPSREMCDGSLLRQMQAEELLFAFAYPVNETQRAVAARALGEKDWSWCREEKCWYHQIDKDKYEVFDYNTWSLRQETSINTKNIKLEKPPVMV